MSGSETCLEDLMSRVYGECVQRGPVVKIADDPYVGATSLAEVFHTRRLLLTAFKRNNLFVDQAYHMSRIDMVQWQLAVYTLVSLLHSLS